MDDPELEAIKARVKAMEEESEKLKELQKEVDMQLSMPANGAQLNLSLEEKMDVDSRNIIERDVIIQPLNQSTDNDQLKAINLTSNSTLFRSVYIGNVDYGATAEELEQHFHGCGSINRYICKGCVRKQIYIPSDTGYSLKV